MNGLKAKMRNKDTYPTWGSAVQGLWETSTPFGEGCRKAVRLELSCWRKKVTDTSRGQVEDLGEVYWSWAANYRGYRVKVSEVGEGGRRAWYRYVLQSPYRTATQQSRTFWQTDLGWDKELCKCRRVQGRWWEYECWWVGLGRFLGASFLPQRRCGLSVQASSCHHEHVLYCSLMEFMCWFSE